LKKKEILWLIGTIAFIVSLSIALFGINGLTSESTLDINVHDTYFVVLNFHVILLLSVLIFFSVYLLRMLRRNFKNLTANIIFIVACIFIIFTLNTLITMVNSFAQFSGTTEYPPLSGGSVEEITKGFGVLQIVLSIVQILLLILLAYSGFKTGLNFKQKD
jgi:heme/copper-type cytochrome/quinol oxidase subunit 1